MPDSISQQTLAAACRDQSNIDIIAVGADSQMYHNSWDGMSWQRGWDTLGGSFASISPSLVSLGPEHLEAFGVDSETGTLLHKTWNGADWGDEWGALKGRHLGVRLLLILGIDVFGVGASSKDGVFHQTFSESTWDKKWEDLAGISISNPAVTSWSTERLDVVVVGTDNSMWHRSWDSSLRVVDNGWTAWETLNGSFLYSPAMVSWSADRLDILAIDSNNSMVFRVWEDDHWSPEWLSLEDSFISSPSLTIWGPGRLDVFALDKGHHMRHRAWDDIWKGWQHDFSTVGTKEFWATPLAVSCTKGRLDVFAVDLDQGLVWHNSWNSSTGNESADGTEWGDWQSIGRLSIKTPSQAPSSPDAPETSAGAYTTTTRPVIPTTTPARASATSKAGGLACHRSGQKKTMLAAMAMFALSMA